MLEAFCGNKNIQKVLLFLFVNNKGYGTQLQRLLNTPLTSLQNALNRLEKGRVITSYNEGKTKLYQLNANHPLSFEIEQLLKKTYTLLPPHEKKIFSLVSLDTAEKRSHYTQLVAFWERLKKVKQFTKTVKSRALIENGWNGKGSGEVIVSIHSDSVILFHEKGVWEGNISFSNTFRWTLDRTTGLISLERFRNPEDAFFLFYLAPSGNNFLASVESHLCEHDVYMATVPWDRNSIGLHWRVIGPKKNEEMEYSYK
jgi:hypothetical protein